MENRGSFLGQSFWLCLEYTFESVGQGFKSLRARHTFQQPTHSRSAPTLNCFHFCFYFLSRQSLSRLQPRRFACFQPLQLVETRHPACLLPVCCLQGRDGHRVNGDLDAVMAWLIFDVGQAFPLLYEQAGEGMPQVMESVGKGIETQIR